MTELTTARWDISTQCNLNCLHCCANGLFADESNTLSLELAIRLLDILRQNGIKNLNILGKEPFLYRHIKGVLQYACNNGFHVDITTNGTQLKDSDLDFLARVGLRRVFFSLDGSSPEVNDAIRGKGVFNRALAAMQRLIARRQSTSSAPKIIVNTVLTKINASDVVPIIDLCNAVGADGFKLSHLNIVGNAVAAASQLALTHSEEFEVIEGVMPILPNYPSLQWDILSPKPKFLEYLYAKHKVSFPVSVSGCKACIREIYVDPSGHVAPCLSTYEGFAGIADVDGTIKDYRIDLFALGDMALSNHPFYEEFQRSFPLTAETYTHYIPCNRCPYLTTICYPCPLGALDSSSVEHLCCIADQKLNSLIRRQDNEIGPELRLPQP